MKMLSKIIHARVVEIIEQVYLEIKNYGYDENKKKLIAGIVLTGGGSQLKHIKQLVEFVTGMDTRIGYPNEHLASQSNKEFAVPGYATAVGLVMKGLQKLEKEVQLKNNDSPETEEETPATVEATSENKAEKDEGESSSNASHESAPEKQSKVNKDPKEKRPGFLENWADKFRKFLNEDL
jgi:cell division protein FtsA